MKETRQWIMCLRRHIFWENKLGLFIRGKVFHLSKILSMPVSLRAYSKAVMVISLCFFFVLFLFQF